MGFQCLDLTDAYCFGFNPDKKKSWRRIAVGTESEGWSEQAQRDITEDLKRNVDASYFRICILEFKDIDTDMNWQAAFVNDRRCWELRIKGEGQPDALDTDKEAFFQSDDFKAACQKAADHITRGYETYKRVLEPRLREGQLIGVNTKKLLAILSYVGEQGGFMDNFRSGSYSSFE